MSTLPVYQIIEKKIKFKGDENIPLLKKIEEFRIGVWEKLIDPATAKARFSLDKYDHNGWHIVYINNENIIASSRLVISERVDSIPDLCSFGPYTHMMTAPLGVLNRLVVSLEFRKLGMASEMIKDRVKMAEKNNVSQIWVEVKQKAVEVFASHGFHEIGISNDTMIEGDWRIMSRTL